MLRKPEMSAGLMGHLARKHTLRNGSTALLFVQLSCITKRLPQHKLSLTFPFTSEGCRLMACRDTKTAAWRSNLEKKNEVVQMTTQLKVSKYFFGSQKILRQKRFVYGGVPWWRTPVQAHWQAHCWVTSGMFQRLGPFPHAQARSYFSFFRARLRF